MTRRGVLGALFGGIAALALATCGSTKRIRYKMTVEVDTPEGLKTGYAVREVRFSEAPNVLALGESRPQWRLKGEAVAIDLPGGRPLFALLSSARNDSEYAARIPYEHMGWMSSEGTRDGPVELWPNVPVKLHHNPSQLKPSYLPMLVTFRDTSSPESVVAVEAEALEAAFGPGVRLRRITVERTRESVTAGLETRLEWLSEQRGSLDYTGQLHPEHREKDVTEHAFWQGIKE